MDLAKLKVPELRTMLIDRKLDTKGSKAELVKRLNDSFSNESFETMETAEEVEDEVEVVEDEVEVKALKHTNDESGIATSKKEDEPIFADDIHCLDWYDSDLSLIIEKENMMAGEPISTYGWKYVWSGARSSRGFVTGKVWYEVKVLGGKKDSFSEIRVGWSTNDTDLMIGNVSTSFAYCSKSGKKRHNNEFNDYGLEFTEGDVIGVFLDLTGPEISMAYTKNGEAQGEAFKINKTLLKGLGLFPHVSTRNLKFEVNFGKEIISEKGTDKYPQYTIKGDGPEKGCWFAPIDGYQFAAFSTSLPNLPRIETRKSCEMITMIGLPGCGKTTWVDQLKAKHPEKRYNVIGVNALIDRMEMDGESIMKAIQGKSWKSLVPAIARGVREWVSQATSRRRNFILDQTNVYAFCHSKDNGSKIIPFNDMYLKAVVIVPSDNDYKSRIDSQKKAAELANDRYTSTEHQIMEMKAGFTLPVEGDESPFKEILFVDLNRDEAAQIVEEYNKLAKEKGFGKENGREKRIRERRNHRDTRGARGIRKLQAQRPAKYGSRVLGQIDSRNLMRNFSLEAMMQQSNSIQNALLQNHLQRGASNRGTSLMGQTHRPEMFDQAQMLQSLFGGQMMQAQRNQLFGGNVSQMMGRGGYYGMGMNARHF